MSENMWDQFLVQPQQAQPAPKPAAPASAKANPVMDRYRKHAAEVGLPPEWLEVFAGQESSGGTDTRDSVQKARGPLQITKGRFLDAGGKNFDDPDDVARTAVTELNRMRLKYKDNPKAVAASWHSGPGNVNPDGTLKNDTKDALGKRTADYQTDIEKAFSGRAKPAPAAEEQNMWDQFLQVEDKSPSPRSLLSPPEKEAAIINDDDSELLKSIKRQFISDNPKVSGAFLEAIGIASGNPAFAKYGQDIQGWSKEQLRGLEPKVASLKDINDIGGFWDWFQNALGSGIASSAPSLISGAAGAAIGSSVGPGGTLAGAVIGAALPGYAMNSGDVFLSAMEDKDIAAKIQSGELTKETVAKAALIAGLPMAALDVIGLGKAIGAIGKPAKSDLVRRIVKGMVTGALAEGVTEGLQEVVSLWAQAWLGDDKSAGERIWSVIENAAAGAVPGAAFGIAGGARGSRGASAGERPKEEPSAAQPAAPSQAGQTATEDQVLELAKRKLNELNQKSQGAPGPVIPGPDGKPVQKMGEQPQFLTDEEKRELEFLKKNSGNAAEIAAAYGLKLTEVAGAGAPQKAPADPALPAFEVYTGNGTNVATPTGIQIGAQFGVADASSLITAFTPTGQANPRYQLAPGANRINQVGADPERLGASELSSEGAPVVGNDGRVESGNNRLNAIRRAYQTAQGTAYKQWLLSNLEQFGIPESSRSAIEAMEQPALIRLRVTPVDRNQFVMESNAQPAPAAPEIGQAPAQAAPAKPADPDSEMTYERAIQVGDMATEVGPAYGAQGTVNWTPGPITSGTIEGLHRVRAEAQARLEEADPGATAVPDILQAAADVATIRAQGLDVAEVLAHMEALGEEFSPEAIALIQALDEANGNPARVADLVRGLISKEQKSRTTAEIIRAQAKELRKKYGLQAEDAGGATPAGAAPEGGATEAPVDSAPELPGAREAGGQTDEAVAEEPARAAGGTLFSRGGASDQTETAEFKRWFGDSKVVDAESRPLVVYHSTSAATNFDAFKRRLGDIGIHFGTLGQAEDRMSYMRQHRNEPGGERVMPVYLSIQKPLRVRDLGSWDADNLEYGLLDAGINPEAIKAAMRSSSSANGKLAALRDLLESLGYDGIVYKNTGETSGAEDLRVAARQANEAMIDRQKRLGKPLGVYDKEDQASPEYKAMSDSFAAYSKFREDNAEDSWIAFRPKQIKSAIGNRGTFDPNNPNVLYSRSLTGKDTALTSFWTMLAQSEDLFKVPLFADKDMAKLAAKIDPAMKVFKYPVPFSKRLKANYEITMPDGKTADVMFYKDGAIVLDASRLVEGSSGGWKLYALLFNFALNNKAVFIGDPAGLSDAALFRRTEQMISAALKAGTTAHMYPHERQVAEGLKWEESNRLSDDERTAVNLQNLLDFSVYLVSKTFPEINDFRYNPESGKFERVSDGSELSEEVLGRALESPGAREARIGRATLARAIVSATALREGGGEGGKPGGFGHQLLASALRQLRAGAVDPALEGSMYSRAGDTAGPVSTQDVEATIAPYRARATGLPNVVVVQSQNDRRIPADLAKLIAREAPGSVAGAYHNGEIFLFADNLRDADHAAFTFLHEAEHHGLAMLLGPEYDAVMMAIWEGNPAVQLAAGKLIRQHRLSRVDAVKEVLADWAGEGKHPTILQRLIAAIRDVARKAGLRLKMNDADVLALIARGKDAWKKGVRRNSHIYSNFSQSAPMFYSQMAGVIGEKGSTATAAEWKRRLDAWASSGAYKRDELEWSGLREWLDLQEGKVTTDAVLGYLRDNHVRVEETVLGERATWRQRRDELRNRGMANLSKAEREELMSLDDRFDMDGPDSTPEGQQTKFGEYTLPGGTNYREVLLTLRPKNEVKQTFRTQHQLFEDGEMVAIGDEVSAARWRERNPSADIRTARVTDQRTRMEEDRAALYRSSHWAKTNVLVHIRVNDRIDADGNKVLFVEEIQSDWAQDGRKMGFAADAMTDRMLREKELEQIQADIRREAREKFGGAALMRSYEILAADLGRSDELRAALEAVGNARNKPATPAAPFVTKTDAWVSLALKRVMRMAAEGGYDRVAFVTGSQVADRFRLSNQVESISYAKRGDVYQLWAVSKEGNQVRLGDNNTESELAAKVGKEMAERIVRGEGVKAGDATILRGVDLEVGGEGMKAFYDKIVPSAASALVKKLGGKPVEVPINSMGNVFQLDETSWGSNVSEQAYSSKQDAIRAASAPQPGFEVTDEMREKVMGGLPLFSRRRVPGSDIGHKREISTGRYVGAPDWVGSSPRMLAELRRKLRQLANEGEPGRFWYENSSRSILEMVGGDKAEAERFVSLIAIYSPNATVPANTSMALTAWYQYKAGLPIDAGFGAADRKAEQLLREGKAWSGIKTNSFYQNLMVEIDPSKLDEGVATMDMWMALAFDYGDKKLDQGPKYRFAEREIAAIAEELGWKAHQVQAAIWTAMKARIDPIRPDLKARELREGIGREVTRVNKTTGKEETIYEIPPERKYDHFRLAHKMGMEAAYDKASIEESKYDFSNAIRERLAQISWEATPGATTGALPEMLEASTQDKVEYLADVAQALTRDGKDVIADMVGLPPGTTILGYSAWQGDVGAGAQTFVPVPSQGVQGKRAVKPAARELLDMYSAARGYVLSQEAVVWHTPVYDDAQIRHNGFELRSPRALTEAEMRQLYDAIHAEFGTWDLAPGYTPNGARVLNFVDGLGNRDFQKRMDKVLKSLPDGFGGGELTHAGYRSDGEYISNDWERNPDGQEYKDRIAARRPDLLGALDRLRADVEAINERWKERLGGQFLDIERPDASRDRRDGGGSEPSYRRGERREDSVSAVGVHYSREQRSQLLGSYYGTGLKGAEAARLQNADPRLRSRIYFYASTGQGVRPEAGVGPHAHTVRLENLYDLDADPRGLRLGRSPNDFELAILEAGFDGYIASFGAGQKGAVLLGNHSVPVAYRGMGYRGQDLQAAQSAEVAPEEQALRDFAKERRLPSGSMAPSQWRTVTERVAPELFARLPEGLFSGDGTFYRDELISAFRQQESFQDLDPAKIEALIASWAGNSKSRRVHVIPALRRAIKLYQSDQDGSAWIQIQALLDRLEQKTAEGKMRDMRKERVRGLDWVKERLLRARRTGELQTTTVDFTLWALEQNPALAEDLGISIRERSDNVAGQYNPASRVITLVAGAFNTTTGVHEILHHAERMMPDEVQSGIEKGWAMAFARAMKKANEKQRKALADMFGAMAGDVEARKRVMAAFQDGTLDYDEHYQLVNPSEFWAVNATRYMEARYNAVTWVQRAKQWMREMIQKLKGLLRLPSDAPVLRGLEAVLKADGSRQTKTMIAQRAGARATSFMEIDRSQAVTPTQRRRSYVATSRKAIERIDRALTPLGSLPSVRKYLARRGIALGEIAQADNVGRSLYDAFAKRDAEVQQQVYEYLTTAEADPNDITDPDARREAVRAKELIDQVGQDLVGYGLLSMEAYEANRGAYLPRLYLKHLLSDQDNKAIGTGKKPSDLGYLKKRKDIPKEIRDVVLGEVKDPGYLSTVGYTRATRDMALLDWLHDISLNDEWVYRKDLVEWEGQRVTAFWLKNEADRIRRQIPYYTGEVAKRANELVARMDALVNPVLDELGKVPADYRQMPDTPRYGRLRGMYVRKEIYEDIVGIGAVVSKDAGWAEKLLGYGGWATRATQFWKTMKVAMNPPGQIRNFLSNAILLQLSGVGLHKVPMRLAQAAAQIREEKKIEEEGRAMTPDEEARLKHWLVAKKYGLTVGTFSSQELYRAEREFLDLQARMRGPNSFMHLINIGAKVMDFAGDIYQFSEAIFKTAKIIDEMERGQNEVDAANEAQKWLFDYSLVSQSVRYLRNAPVGAPFITFAAKVAPRMLEVALHAPWRFAPWVALAYTFPMIVASMGGPDEEDQEKLKKLLPDAWKDKGHVYVLPWKDESGRWQVLDLSYLMPWTMFTSAGKQLARGDVQEATQTMGLVGGPLPDIITAWKTGKDSFTQRDIVQKGDPLHLQLGALLTYVYNMAAPPILTDRGLVGPSLGDPAHSVGGKLPSALRGSTNRYGDPVSTLPQAAAGAVGFNVRSVDPVMDRAKKVMEKRRELDDVKARLKQALMDRALSKDERAKVVQTYLEEIKRRNQKLQEFSEATR